jgi:hypothetical protein
MNPKAFFGELRRRNVLKVAVAYAAIAWLLIEATSLWLSAVAAPPGVIKGVIVLLALGFATIIYISWAFEATPGGLKRTAKVSPEEINALPSWSPRKFAAFIVTTALLAAGLHVFHLLRSKPASTSPPATTGTNR